VASVEDPLTSQAVVELRRAVRRAAPDTLLGIQSDRVVIVLGGPGDLRSALEHLVPLVGKTVVIGPVVAGLESAPRSVRAASAGLDAAPGWPTAPRPVEADELLPERVLMGDPTARVTLIETTYQPLVDAGGDLVATLWAYFATGRSLEAAARMLFVHPNTVRYRLRKVTEVCSWDATEPRESYVLHVALTVGRLALGHTS
jgi:DNA-binding PucR family transcriptional regulator